MSDFKNITDFRKSAIRKYPYQDPTYLSFVMLFDFVDTKNSPLLSSAAEDFLSELASNSSFYKERLLALQNFKKALKTINNEMPWFWQSLGGLEKIQQYNPLEPYFGAGDSKLTIGCLESINLTIAGLMHLYRKAVFDERKWTFILPANLRKFRMYVYVTEVRSIKSKFDMGTETSDGMVYKDANAEILGQQNRPYFMFGLKYCQFDMATGTNIFSDLSKSPEVATNEISIGYEAIDVIESRVLAGLIDPPPTEINQISPSPEIEGVIPEQSKISKLKAKASAKFDDIKDKAEAGLKQLAAEKKRELEQLARDQVTNRIPSTENIFANLVRGIDEATDVNKLTKNITSNINENIFNLTGNKRQSIADALGNAANGSLGNVHE